MSRDGSFGDVRVLTSPGDRGTALRDDVYLGLTSTPKSLPPKWFYDERGSVLFDEITRLPEYYPTRTERSILERHAEEIAAFAPADTLIELGSGTSEKTRRLIDALQPERFVPFDVSEEILRESVRALNDDYPDMDVEAVVGDFELHLDALPREGRRLMLFLGSTIGNFPPVSRAMFLRDVADTLDPGDGLLLGADLVKDPARLVAAYDDSQGVTAEFNLNVLSVLNRELEADFDLDVFAHVARWDVENEWMEMSVRSLRAQVVRVEALDLEVTFRAGELMRTEISAKFRPEGLAAELAGAGLTLEKLWTDPAGDFSVSLSTPTGTR
jgi:L-histidine Nalpha-methyltransferase